MLVTLSELEPYLFRNIAVVVNCMSEYRAFDAVTECLNMNGFLVQ